MYYFTSYISCCIEYIIKVNYHLCKINDKTPQHNYIILLCKITKEIVKLFYNM